MSEKVARTTCMFCTRPLDLGRGITAYKEDWCGVECHFFSHNPDYVAYVNRNKETTK